MSVPHLLLLLGSASALGCPGSDWAEAGASCYHRSSRSLSWREGNDYCQQQGGYMVEVKICNGFRIRRQGQIGLERSASWSLLRIHGPREWRDRPTDRGQERGQGRGRDRGLPDTIRLVWWDFWWFIRHTRLSISDPDFSCGRKDGQTGQPEVVQEVLADLEIILRMTFFSEIGK